MTQKDSIKAEIDFLKITINTLIGFMIAIAIYNLQVLGTIVISATVSIIIIGIVTVAVRLKYNKLLLELKELP